MDTEKASCKNLPEVQKPVLGCEKEKRKAYERHGLSWRSNGKMMPLYGVWLAMKGRCFNKNNGSYKRYGGRGISVCYEWKESYLAFHKWAFNSGYEKGLTVERIDNSRGYSPNNCKFADRVEQANNRRTNHILVYRGKKYTCAQLARKAGLRQHTLLCRIRRGWSVEDSVSKPLDNRGGVK